MLDEPTASLPGADVQRLFEAIRRLKARGVAILYVSHHLDEVFEIADEVTVLRDGKPITTLDVGELNHGKLIELMIGHKVTLGTSTAQRIDDEVRLAVHGLAGGNVECLDLDLHSGEIVGVAGITGSGRESVVPLIAGHMPSTAGSVVINGIATQNYAPRETVQSGARYLAADRTAHGVFKYSSVVHNTTISDVKRNTKFGRLLLKQERQEAQEWIDKLGVKTAGGEAQIGSLSGGNQQKVLFARGLRLRPTVIMLDEPTRGIDVGAKEEIHSSIDQSAANGAAVLMVSTDTDEIVRPPIGCSSCATAELPPSSQEATSPSKRSNEPSHSLDSKPPRRAQRRTPPHDHHPRARQHAADEDRAPQDLHPAPAPRQVQRAVPVGDVHDRLRVVAGQLPQQADVHHRAQREGGHRHPRASPSSSRWRPTPSTCRSAT